MNVLTLKLYILRDTEMYFFIYPSHHTQFRLSLNQIDDRLKMIESADY